MLVLVLPLWALMELQPSVVKLRLAPLSQASLFLTDAVPAKLKPGVYANKATSVPGNSCTSHSLSWMRQ